MLRNRMLPILSCLMSFSGFCDCLAALKSELQSNRQLQVTLSRTLINSWHRDSEDLYQTKAAERESPLHFDLSDIFELSNRAFDAKDATANTLLSQIRDLSQYELIILGLRSGDALKFDNSTFTLGEFLGRGNSTHVWSLKDDPNRVIRLPFLVGMLRERGTAGLYARQKYMRDTLDKLQASKNSPELFDYDEDHYTRTGLMRYQIYQRINGTETGSDFIQRISNGAIDPESERISFLKSTFDTLFSHPEARKLELLVEAMKADNAYHLDTKFQVANDPLSLDWVDLRIHEWPSVHLIQSRQYLWDTLLERWFLIDGK